MVLPVPDGCGAPPLFLAPVIYALWSPSDNLVAPGGRQRRASLGRRPSGTNRLRGQRPSPVVERLLTARKRNWASRAPVPPAVPRPLCGFATAGAATGGAAAKALSSLRGTRRADAYCMDSLRLVCRERARPSRLLCSREQPRGVTRLSDAIPYRTCAAPCARPVARYHRQTGQCLYVSAVALCLPRLERRCGGRRGWCRTPRTRAGRDAATSRPEGKPPHTVRIRSAATNIEPVIHTIHPSGVCCREAG